MVRGREETSTSGCPGGRPRAKPSASNGIASLTMEDLKVYCEVLDNIDLRLMERADDSTLGGKHNGVFFTREHLAAGLRFSALYPGAAVPRPSQRDSYPDRQLCTESFVPALSLSGRILVIYSLSIGQGSRMSMSVLNPRFQIVIGLPDSPKTEAKGALLARRPWDETPGSPGLPFNVNRSQSFPGLFVVMPILVC